jgi:itaconate CoA-transferase
VSICDITSGMNAVSGIQQALLQRYKTGKGSGIQVSLFASAADLMAVPYLHARYGKGAPQRVGLKHPSIAPYGSFTCGDGRELVLSIQNEREWLNFCTSFMQNASVATDARYVTNDLRVKNRDALEAQVQAVFATLTYAQAVQRLTTAQTAYGAINSVQDLIHHPQLRTKPMQVNGQTALIPANPYVTEWDDAEFAKTPDLEKP